MFWLRNKKIRFSLHTLNFSPVLTCTTMHKLIYSKCSKIMNTFLFLFSNKMLVINIRSRIHKMLVRTANREDPDQTSSPEEV